MNPPTSRLAPAMGLALGLAVAFVPFGCGGSEDFTAVPSHGSFDAPEAPPRTVQAITACAERGAGRLKDMSYAITFNVDVTPSGDAREAKVRDSMIPDHELESCIGHALEEMQVPRYILAKASRPSPQSRAPVGNVVVLVGVAELVPILIVVAGVSIIVGVTVQIVAEEISKSPRNATDDDSEKERCKKVKRACIAYCSQTTLPTPDFGWKFQKCKNDCLERRGCPRDS